MVTRTPVKKPTPRSIQALRLDLSILVGNVISVYSDQFPGHVLETKVLSYVNRELLVNSGGSNGKIGNLVSRQQVVLQFPYKGQRIAVRAEFQRSKGGRCYFTLNEDVTPLAQRRFRRYPLVTSVDLASYPVNAFGKVELSRLRWLKTDTVNFSSGGALLTITSVLQEGTYLLMHFNLQEDWLPSLILAQVRHTYQVDHARFRTGVEFMVREVCNERVRHARLQELPPTVYSYRSNDRERLNQLLQARMHTGSVS